MGLFKSVRGHHYEGPTYPEFGTPFGAVKAGEATTGMVRWPMRVTGIRHEQGRPIGAPLTAFLDGNYEGYDVFGESRAPFDWAREADGNNGQWFVDVTLDPYRLDDQLVPIADLLAETNNNLMRGASAVVVEGELRGVSDHARYAGRGAKRSPDLTATAVYWRWWPAHTEQYFYLNPNRVAYPDEFKGAMGDSHFQAIVAQRALDEGWWTTGQVEARYWEAVAKWDEANKAGDSRDPHTNIAGVEEPARREGI